MWLVLKWLERKCPPKRGLRLTGGSARKVLAVSVKVKALWGDSQLLTGYIIVRRSRLKHSCLFYPVILLRSILCGT